MTDNTRRLVTVFGGTGFLGREIVTGLARAGLDVRVAVRRPDLAPATAVAADVRDEASVKRAVEGVSAVVNAVGLYVERGDETFEAVHAQGAGTVAGHAAQAGVARVIHVSGIGADPRSGSSYVRSRAKGEALVREAFPGATILRPSVLFGPGDAMFGALAAIARRAPVIPLFGRGETRLQPVHVGDVAAAVVNSLDDPSAEGATYELGGPDIVTYRSLVDLVLKHLGKRRVLLPVPFPVWEVQASLLGVLPNPPLTRDQVTLMKDDNVVGPDALTLADLGIVPTPVEAILPAIIGPAG